MNAQTQEQFEMINARITRLEALVEEYHKSRAEAILAYHRKQRSNTPPPPPPVVDDKNENENKTIATLIEEAKQENKTIATLIEEAKEKRKQQVTILPSTRKECGMIDGKINFPLFRMGDCGNDRRVITSVAFDIPDKMDKQFFEKIAREIKKPSFRCFDWHWPSFKKNVIMPNREHIKQVMGLNELFINRVVNDLHICLNNWDSPEGLEEVGDEDYIPVCHETFFTHEDLDY